MKLANQFIADRCLPDKVRDKNHCFSMGKFTINGGSFHSYVKLAEGTCSCHIACCLGMFGPFVGPFSTGDVPDLEWP